MIEWNHEVISPRDAASGLPTGKRQHKPLSVTGMVDKATPILYNILVNNENITDFALRLWRPAGRPGGPVLHHRADQREHRGHPGRASTTSTRTTCGSRS